MTCIKTGATVYMRPYDRVLCGDVYQVGNTRILRVIPSQLNQARGGKSRMRIDYGLPDWNLSDPGLRENFWREDIGVFVVPEDCLQEIRR